MKCVYRFQPKTTYDYIVSIATFLIFDQRRLVDFLDTRWGSGNVGVMWAYVRGKTGATGWGEGGGSHVAV